ncbi:MAG: GGDEF domain-containing protein [Desulfobacteraceae bacterium]|jgi:diguanylate cyclase (GGDEF)-like protein
MTAHIQTLLRKPSEILDAAGFLFQRNHHKDLNRHILAIHKLLTIEDLVNETSRILKDILAYKLFAFAIQDESGLNIWSDPVLSKQRLLDMIAKDFPGTEINCLTCIKQESKKVIHTYFHKTESVSSTVIQIENSKSCVYLVHDKSRFFSADKSADIIIQAFENALENILRIRSLEKASSTDPLTGCYNRRALKNQLERSMNNARRYKRDLSVIMFDVDHFKSINDCYGHLFGDTVLKTISASVEHLIRKGDYIARYGGEEFLVVLPETPLSTAVDIAHRLKCKVESLLIQNPCRKKLKITASYGVAAMGADDDMEIFLSEADTMLYLAKTNGRNCVMAANQ